MSTRLNQRNPCFCSAFTANETAHETKHAAGIKSGIKSGQSQLQHAMLERVIRELSGQIRDTKRNKYDTKNGTNTANKRQTKTVHFEPA